MAGTSSDEILQLLRLAERGYENRDAKLLVDIGGELERKGIYEPAWLLLADAPLMRKPADFPEWDGAPLPEGTLLVRKRIRHLGAELRMARFIASASKHVPRTIIATEPRLVDLLARSFPEAEVVGKDAVPALSGRVHEASYERLAQFFGADETAIHQSWRPLRARPTSYWASGKSAVSLA